MTNATQPFDALMNITARPTTVFVKGMDGLQWLQQHDPDYDGFIIERDHTLATEGFLELVAS